MATAASAKALALASIFIVLVSATIVITETDAAGSNSFEVTDGKGIVHSFDNPVEHVISMGVGTTEAIIQVGSVDKIVVTDNYSYTTGQKYDIFKEFIEKCDKGDIVHQGSAYNWSDLKTAILDAADEGRFNKTTDAIFLTYTGNTDSGYSELVEAGFTKILRWEKPKSYDDVVDFITAVSMVTTGEVGKTAGAMKELVKYLDDGFTEHPEWTMKKAFYVTYSGSQFKVGNTGSLGTTILQAAHLNVITIDKSRSESTYAADLTSLIEKYGEDTLIFVDESSIATKPDKLNNLRDQVGKEVKIYCMDYLWNNYSVTSASGVWSAACTAYYEYDTEFFDVNKVLVPLNSEEEQMSLFIIAGIIVSLVMVAITYYFSRD